MNQRIHPATISSGAASRRHGFGQHVVVLTPQTSRSWLAKRDLTHGIHEWRLWFTMAWADIKMRYRRSILGPFWITLSMGISILVMGLLYAKLFKIDTRTYMPHLTLGLLVWGYVQGIVTDGCQAFVQSENFIKQTRLPYCTYIFRIVARNLIILGHNAIVYIGVLAIFRIVPNLNFLLIVPAFALVLLNSIWIALMMGIFCTRFRDIPNLIISLLQVVFFVTPIMWTPNLLGAREYLVNLNPAYHVVELIRAPLLGESPSATNWYFMLGMTVVGCGLTFLLFMRYRNRISYWL